MITCFNKMLKSVKKVPKENLAKSVELIYDDDILGFLGYCLMIGVFGKEQYTTAYDAILLWDESGNWEADYKNTLALVEALGITDEVMGKYSPCVVKGDKVKALLQCLKDNGIDEDEAPVVAQAIGYILLDDEFERYLE